MDGEPTPARSAHPGVVGEASPVRDVRVTTAKLGGPVRCPVLPALALALSACDEAFDVDIQGVLVQGWEAGAPALGGASITTLDARGDEVAQTISSSSGWYRLAASPGQPNIVVVEGEGLVRSSFQGNPGLNPRFRIPNGEIFGVPTQTWSDEVDRWDGCPGLGTGATLFARLEIEGFVGGGDGEVVPVQTGYATLRLADGREIEPCYLDEDGRYSPTAARTGPSASLLAAGLPAGVHELELRYEPFQGIEQTYFYQVQLVADTLAPRVPLLVPFN